MIYLIKSEQRNGTLYKVGFTTNLIKRMAQYKSHNPNTQLLETVATYGKTKRHLESVIHSEITYNFVNDSEWFFVPIEYEKDFESKGLSQFKACKNRKIIKHNPTA